MSLLKVVGVTSTNLTFSVAFAFLDAKKEDNYVWALLCLKNTLDPEVLPSVIITDRELALMNALKSIFPQSQNFLCRFHISHNMAANCKKLFSNGKVWENFIFRFNELVFSSTEDEYASKLDEFQAEFSDYLDALAYVIKNWLCVYKELFIVVWTDRFTHFGNTASNIAEGAHSRLKKCLGTSQGNFSSTWNVIHQMLLTEHVEIKASLERSLILVRHDYNGNLYDELGGFFSRAALDIIAEHVKVADSIRPDDTARCGYNIHHTHGLPCACEIIRYKLSRSLIPLSCINIHWKKLSDQPYVSPVTDLDCEPDIELFKKHTIMPTQA